MTKYAKITNEETKECSVGIGTNEAFYKSIGMTEMDVEKCEWNNQWYLKDFIPQEPEEQVKQKKIQQFKNQLKEVDEKSSRSMRAVLAGTATEDDRAFLANLESQAEDLRRQIKELQDTLGE